MIVSVHIASVGARSALRALRRRPSPSDGTNYAQPVLTAPLGQGLLPKPTLGKAGLIAAWDEDSAIDRFLAEDDFGRMLAGGWHARMEPLGVSGAWTAMPELPRERLPVDPNESVAVLTLGRLRLSRAVSFVRTSAPAERAAVEDPALLASTGLARPPHLVSTFSLWRSAAQMRDYAGRTDAAHLAAVRAHGKRPFHHESAFIRLRPYRSEGSWDGSDPLADAALSASTS